MPICNLWQSAKKLHFSSVGEGMTCLSTTKTEQTEIHTRECKCSLGSFWLSSNSAILSSYHKCWDHRTSGKWWPHSVQWQHQQSSVTHTLAAGDSIKPETLNQCHYAELVLSHLVGKHNFGKLFQILLYPASMGLNGLVNTCVHLLECFMYFGLVCLF